MTTEIINRKTFSPIRMKAGDTLVVTYTDKLGVSHQLTEHKTDGDMVIDTAVIIKVGNEYGLKSGFGCVLGESA